MRMTQCMITQTLLRNQITWTLMRSHIGRTFLRSKNLGTLIGGPIHN
jgi:hypothetical protein